MPWPSLRRAKRSVSSDIREDRAEANALHIALGLRDLAPWIKIEILHLAWKMTSVEDWVAAIPLTLSETSPQHPPLDGGS